MRIRLLPAAAFLSIAEALYSPFTAAAQLASMSVSVTATGTDATRSEGEWSKGTFSYRAAFTMTLETDGELSNVNMYDPDFARKSMETAAVNMAKIQAAMNGQFSDDEETAEPEDRYLLYLGQVDCPLTLAMEISEKLEGAYADVGGMQPYAVTFTANSGGTSLKHNMLCVANSSILDVKDNVLYRSTLGFPEITGHYILREENRGNIIDNAQSVHSALPVIVSEYVFDTLRVAPARGQSKTTLTPTEPVLTRSGPFGGYHGSVEVELTWDFAPINK